MAENTQIKVEKLIKYGKKQLGFKGVESTAETIREILEDIEKISMGSANLGEKTINQNGIYNSSLDSLDGYKKVNVNVRMLTEKVKYSLGESIKITEKIKLLKPTTKITVE